MNYEKIIVELLSRIQVLEEKVDTLMERQSNVRKEDEYKMTTEQIREYIRELKRHARVSGKETLVLRSGDIHKELNLKSRFPMVCNAMRQCMENGDEILYQPPKGNSSTLEIKYNCR